MDAFSLATELAWERTARNAEATSGAWSGFSRQVFLGQEVSSADWRLTPNYLDTFFLRSEAEVEISAMHASKALTAQWHSCDVTCLNHTKASKQSLHLLRYNFSLCLLRTQIVTACCGWTMHYVPA